MAEELGLEADLVVGQRVRRERERLDVLRGALRVRARHRVEHRLVERLAARAVEPARPVTLRVGVVEHRVRCDVPGDVAAPLRALVLNVETLTVFVGAVAVAGCRGLEAAERGADPAPLVELVVVVAHATGDRQHLREDVEVDRGELGNLPVALVGVLEEADIVAARIPVVNGHSRFWREVALAGHAATRNDVRGASGNRLVAPRRVVVDPQSLGVDAGDEAQAPVVRGADAELVRQVRGALLLAPGRARRAAGRRQRAIARAVDRIVACGAEHARTGAVALVVVGVHATCVIRVVLHLVDGAVEVATGVDSVQRTDFAVQRPRRIRELVVVVRVIEQRDLARLQCNAV